MHPTFVKLFLEADADELLAEEEDKRRRANRAKRTRSRMAIRVAADDREHEPRPAYVDNSGISAQPTTGDGRSWTTCPFLWIRRSPCN
jgi:hypothetical protein